MPKSFRIKAGERVRVLWLFSDSIPATVRFTAKADGQGPLGGTVEMHRQRWFQWHRSTHELRARNAFDKGFADGDYRIFVTPDQDCTITFETRHFRAETFFWVLAAILILGLIAGSVAWIFADPATPSLTQG